ncbi:MAG: LysM peptidoglycan-binding domain-containing protein, partial [Saprospiraceae bacterium]
MPTSTYHVVSGDTLYRISQKFGMSLDDLKSLNHLSSNNLSIGQSLLVRTAGTTAPAATVTPGNPVFTTIITAVTTISTVSYRVVPGDTLFGIARKFGMSVQDLQSINRLTSSNLSVGQMLQVHGSVTPTPVQPPPVVVHPTPTPTPPSNSDDYRAARRQFPLEIRQDAGFNRFFLTVPLLDGGQVVASMRDNVPSQFRMYPQGIMYPGQSHIAVDLATIQSVGLTARQSHALQYVSTHEGSFDAINSYDQAIFSYGFIQFTGASAVGGSLNQVMASMKAYAPQSFQRVFQRVGIDAQGSGKAASVTVLDEFGNRQWGDQAWLYIQRTPQLYGAFVQAGFEPVLVREQLRMANALYVQPALNFSLDLNVAGIRVHVPRISDILSSEAALTLVIALAVNQGVGGMSRTFSAAITAVASRMGLTSSAALANINEQQVVENIAQTSTDARVTNRVNGVLQSGLSFA